MRGKLISTKQGIQALQGVQQRDLIAKYASLALPSSNSCFISISILYGKSKAGKLEEESNFPFWDVN
jgi:hypothetical protein